MICYHWLVFDYFQHVEDEGMIGVLFPQTKWPKSLRYAETKTISNADCNVGLAPHRRVDDTMMCTGHEEALGLCYGDYGSPLVDLTDPEHPVQVGVASQTIGVNIQRRNFESYFILNYSFFIGIAVLLEFPRYLHPSLYIFGLDSITFGRLSTLK